MLRIVKFPHPFGHFRIVRRLGHGGMGDVYLADDTKLGCQVALKIPRFSGGDHEEDVARFHREADIGFRVRHPYLCRVHEHDEIDGIHFLTMPVIEGKPLSELVKQQRWEQRRAAVLVRRLALAVQALHKDEVIHRDLKPHNVMVQAEDRPILMDFGLARSLQPDERRLTVTGRVMGTPAYMPPELVRGDHRNTGPATDVYSLGAMFYELLTGRPPFQGRSDWDLFNQIVNTPPPSPSGLRSDLASSLEAVCLKALSKRPEDRHASMAELEKELAAFLGQGPDALPPPAASAADPVSLSAPSLLTQYSSPLAEAVSPALPGTASFHGHVPDKTVAVSLGSGVEMGFAWIPPGTFLMGSPDSEPERSNDETQHRVTLTKGFYLGVHPVTQAQWQAVMGDNPSEFKGDTLPVEKVSWDDCQGFVKVLSEKTGRQLRLPTEAEWEYACRAGTTTPFYFGETISTDQANYNGNYTYGKGRKGVYREKTTPVGSFPANAWGLHDMHGNVWEWCQDWYGDCPKEDQKDPFGDNSGNARVVRGGSWCDVAGYCRAARRGWLAPGYHVDHVGCRLVLRLD